MPTYNMTKGDTELPAIDSNRFFVVKIPVVVADIIAANATLTANGKITAADVIQLWDIPANVALLVSMATFKVVTAGTAAGTANIGLAGSNELFVAIALDSAAGTVTSVPKNGGWGTDNYGAVPFSAADTLDMTFVADETKGSFVIYLPCYKLD